MTKQRQLSSSLSTLVCLIIMLNVVATSEYDSIECDPHSNRARGGRARLIQSIPCDLTKQNFCNLPGDSYPWNAVKKFVYDNQGLVRRMYGDMRHMFVMQSELENEIDFEDVQHTADKYSKAFNEHNKRQGKAIKKTSSTTTTKRGERKTYRNGDTSEPHFRPAQRPLNTKQRTKPPKVADKNSLIDNLINSNANADETKSKTTESTDASSEVMIGKSTSSSSSSTTPENTTIDDDHSEKESDRKENETVDKAVLDLFGNISSVLAAASSTTLTSSTLTTTTASAVKSSQEPSITERNAQLEPDEVTLDSDEIISEILYGDSPNIVSSTSNEPLMTTTTKAQLFQDSKVMQVPVNRRGVNACPVKEEVVAPFWGNNTRGEILALLNVYPFEQYINWEKCSHENEQMYCRKGCRCEQQYRLHRLLAYNPLDACRGIFSDWFRFPSCCICKCYDIPLDYRVTSRSPRGSENILDDAIDNDEVLVVEEVENENDFIDDDEEDFFDDSG